EPEPGQDPLAKNPIFKKVDPIKKILETPLSPEQKERIHKQVLYENCFKREMKEPIRKLRNLMMRDLGVMDFNAVMSSENNWLLQVANIASLGIWLWDLNDFNNDYFEPARQAAMKKCREEAGLP